MSVALCWVGLGPTFSTCSGLGQSADGMGWIESHKMEPWTTLVSLCPFVKLFVDRSISFNCNDSAIAGNESLPKIIVHDTINSVFVSCNQHFGNFKTATVSSPQIRLC